MNDEIPPWVRSDLPSTMAVVGSARRRAFAEIVDTLIPVEKLGQYTVPMPASDFTVRLLPGGVLPSEIQFWRLRQFFRNTEKEKFLLSGFGAEESPVFSCKYLIPELRWIAQEFCVSPSYLIEENHSYVQISNEQLRYTIVGLHRSCVKVFDQMFGGFEQLKEDTRGLIDAMEFGFGEEDRQWVRKFLFRRAYDRNLSDN